jgi:hypothetical protein
VQPLKRETVTRKACAARYSCYVRFLGIADGLAHEIIAIDPGCVKNNDRAFTEGICVLPPPRFPGRLAIASEDIGAREEAHSTRSSRSNVLTTRSGHHDLVSDGRGCARPSKLIFGINLRGISVISLMAGGNHRPQNHQANVRTIQPVSSVSGDRWPGECLTHMLWVRLREKGGKFPRDALAPHSRGPLACQQYARAEL